MYHLNTTMFAGGYLGVPVFLTLSGYLITDHLLDEYQKTDSFNFKYFWSKRIKRLYPTLIMMLIATASFITLFQRDLLANLWKIIVTNLTYVYNWWEILNHQSYFQQFAGMESPFTHLWTLAIEGQFYLIWPILVVILLLLFKKQKKSIFYVALGLAIFSGLLMAFLYVPGKDPSRVYYGTDTRMFSILLGCALACVIPSEGLNENVDKSHVRLLDALGAIGLLGMIIMLFTLNGQATFTYRGGMFLFSCLTLLVIIAIVHPASHFNRLFSGKIYHWIGSRSYAIYVYQLPVMVFFSDKFPDVADHFWLFAIIEVAIILSISELSYRFVEKPFANLDYRKIWQAIKNPQVDLKQLGKKLFQKNRVTKGLIIALIGITLIGTVQSFGINGSAANHSELANRITKNGSNQTQNNEEVQQRLKSGKPVKTQIAKSDKSQGLTKAKLKKAQDIKASAFGDSVMLDGQPRLHKIFPLMYIQATVSLHPADAVSQIKQAQQKGLLGNVVLIGLGTNGPIAPSTFNQIMKIVGPSRQVFWINVHSPRQPWQNQVNTFLNQQAKKHKNLTIINWNNFVSKHPGILYSDQTHPNVKGAKKYADFIANCILSK